MNTSVATPSGHAPRPRPPPALLRSCHVRVLVRAVVGPLDVGLVDEALDASLDHGHGRGEAGLGLTQHLERGNVSRLGARGIPVTTQPTRMGCKMEAQYEYVHLA